MQVEVAPYVRGEAITKSDTVNIPGGLTDAVYVGGAGVVVWINQADVACSITAVAGGLLPIRAKRINDASTTATVMTALYRQ